MPFERRRNLNIYQVSIVCFVNAIHCRKNLSIENGHELIEIATQSCREICSGTGIACPEIEVHIIALCRCYIKEVYVSSNVYFDA